LRYLILSDIHANLAALEAVLADAGGKYDAVVNCGDIVGYGPDPDEAVRFSRDRCAAVVRGNHDKAVAGLADLDWFNDVARTSIEWTASQLKHDYSAWLTELPQGPVEFDGFTLVHGAPQDEDEYIVDPLDVRHAGSYLTTGVTFFGHTHVQGAFEIHRNGTRILSGPDFLAEETSAFLINPGSVGQPRDGDPRAAYALYDTSSRVIALHRVAYDIDRTYDRIIRAGLPEILALRLYQGV
jgi:predicted phosphodiesterase